MFTYTSTSRLQTRLPQVYIRAYLTRFTYFTLRTLLLGCLPAGAAEGAADWKRIMALRLRQDEGGGTSECHGPRLGVRRIAAPPAPEGYPWASRRITGRSCCQNEGSNLAHCAGEAIWTGEHVGAGKAARLVGVAQASGLSRVGSAATACSQVHIWITQCMVTSCLPHDYLMFTSMLTPYLPHVHLTFTSCLHLC